MIKRYRNWRDKRRLEKLNKMISETLLYFHSKYKTLPRQQSTLLIVFMVVDFYNKKHGLNAKVRFGI